ncbi:MAG: preprotein translocase subunit SecA [SAR202 cluster bacterium]|jgi:preprotein translocase subunit SecA|nr:preprotein translocase subunit SecA [SAR202 cluster bacterium]MDP7102380.1 preprotein translocase subunit SecA [SAR202 cluster bacterium]MDP7224932.1 preprotein translocase subunit SecA [SAR202 cluster bacterium]MDP7412109.1 preprotein translocase subunit SecA [SAR202 cluster bacterium]HJO82975.1 preprotein translocase subunit SecA [SAR202 cluster bacterium]|tara:strand:+ start:2594 stop:5266 length:2673 start_codon:yes stop_codon:yes gene_type:complete
MLKSLAKFIGGSDDKIIKKMLPDVDEVNELEPEYERLSDDELREKTWEFRQRLSEGSDLDDLLPEAFAAVREAAKRALGQRHFDVQLMGGIVLHEGRIAEMRTGEGKTLVATLPVYLNSLSGEGVHVVTVNDYLARRDAHWMGAVYDRLGVTVGVLQHGTMSDRALLYDASFEDGERGVEHLTQVARADAYAADITYGTNNEFGFDYLRDNMKVEMAQRVQRPLAYAIVDEVDNILIDEARTPLIISGPAEMSARDYQKYARLVPSLQGAKDYVVDEKHRTVSLTNEGITKLERLLNINNLYGPENFGIVHHVENALKAQVIFQRDREYVVQNGEVIIVDEFTGRLMEGRRYSDGLHQALEAKESARIQAESITYATITLQNYFRLYKKLSGMTGTASTEAEEFWKIYKLDVVAIPTNRPMVRDDKSDLVYRDQNAKYQAVVEEIEERSKNGQPVLVGTTDIDKSEMLSEMLKRRGVAHEVLNAKQHEREATIVAQAGKPGAVTVATNMAGRGTDIVLGGSPDIGDLSPEEWQANHAKVLEAGGLHIIGTERHEARRIDNQLRGRSGRQGDSGATRFYVALDDELMRRFGGDQIRRVMDWAGLDAGTPIENKMINRSIENAQVKVESFHFDQRKHLVEYDDVVNTHRDVMYAERDKILSGANLRDNVEEMIHSELSLLVSDHLGDRRPESWHLEELERDVNAVLPSPEGFVDTIDDESLGIDDIESRLHRHASAFYDRVEDGVSVEVMREVERRLMLQSVDANWVQHLTSMENLRQGIGLHAYGQRDPLVMYKKEGHEQFQALQEKIEHDIVHSIFRIQVNDTAAGNGQSNGSKQPQRAGRSAQPPQNKTVMSNVIDNRRQEAVPAKQKVGRNQACPCGSGKKYKRCHGA